MMKRILETMRDDFYAVFSRDPAARNKLEVMLCYSGLHAIWAHRAAHWLWKHNFKLLARALSQVTRGLTGVEIHPGAKIGVGFFIDHGMGVVIGETAEIGKNVTLYHGVTLGGVSIDKGKRHPTLRDNVVVGAGAKVLGAIEIGKGSRIGANAVVVKPVPAHSIVVGVPGRVIKRRKPMEQVPDLNHGRLPDTVAAALASVVQRLESLEEKINLQEPAYAEDKGDGNGSEPGEGRMLQKAIQILGLDEWYDDDFVI